MGELQLERMRVFDPRCVYMNTRLIHIELRNGSDDEIIVKSISCKFEMEDGLNFPIKQPQIISLPAGHRTQQTIQFEVGLELTPGSNVPSVEVECLMGHMKPKTITFPHPVGSIVIENIPHRSSFFISHKTSEDTKLAQRLGHYLEKIGFGGYNAEIDRRPGQDLWDEKFFPAIDGCVGLIVLWTAEAEKHPESIKKEILYANEKNKRIMPVVEKGTNPPDVLTKNREYFEVDTNVSEHDLVRLVRSIYNLYMKDELYSDERKFVQT